MSKFYRVANAETGQGLWYDSKGNFTGNIHSEFDFCKSSKLKMDFDEKLVGYLSATDNLEDLWLWFTKEEVIALQKFNYYIHEYEAIDYKWYDKFKHWVIDQQSSVVIRQIKIF